jgi:hypothetical protein
MTMPDVSETQPKAPQIGPACWQSPTAEELNRMATFATGRSLEAIVHDADNDVMGTIDALTRLAPHRDDILLPLTAAAEYVAGQMLTLPAEQCDVRERLANRAYRAVIANLKTETPWAACCKRSLMQVAEMTFDRNEAANSYLVIIRSELKFNGKSDLYWQALNERRALFGQRWIEPPKPPKPSMWKRVRQGLGLV